MHFLSLVRYEVGGELAVVESISGEKMMLLGVCGVAYTLAASFVSSTVLGARVSGVVWVEVGELSSFLSF